MCAKTGTISCRVAAFVSRSTEVIITDSIQKAIRHEAGHTIAGLHLEFAVERISIVHGMLRTELFPDLPGKTNHEYFIVLAAGIAAEQFFYGNYDVTACGADATKIMERGDSSIETYLPDALKIIRSNESRLRRLVCKLAYRLQEGCAEAALVAGASLESIAAPSFELLSTKEIQDIWHEKI